MKDLILTNEEAKHGCGIGHGAQCCKFLLMHPEDGFICGRETELKDELIHASNYTAQRLPTEPYPECQLKAIPEERKAQ